MTCRARRVEGVRRHLLRDVPQPAPEDRRPGARHDGCDECRGTCAGVGESRRQAPRGPDAALRRAAAATVGHRQLRVVARGGARSRRGGASESGTHRAVSSPESRRIPECDPRSAGARHRRDAAAADRRGQLRLRQHRRRPEAVAAPDRALSQRRAESGAPRAGHAGAAQRRPVPRARPARSGCAPRGHAGRNARRHAHRLLRAPGRRVRHQGAPRARHRLRHPALHRRAEPRNQRRRRAGADVHAARHPGRGSQHRTPGVQGAWHGDGPRGPPGRRQRRPDSGRRRAGAEKARRQLGDSRAAQGRRARDSRDLPHEDRRGVRGLPQAVSEAVHRPRPDRREGNARRRGAAVARDHGPAQPWRRRRHRPAIVASSSVIRPKPAEEAACAKTILSTLARRAYRRPVTDADVKVLLDFYNEGPRRAAASTRASSWRSSASS